MKWKQWWAVTAQPPLGLVHGWQWAKSEPSGDAFLVGTRNVLEGPVAHEEWSDQSSRHADQDFGPWKTCTVERHGAFEDSFLFKKEGRHEVD